MDSHYYAVIMAGGGGTRLWPLSRRDRPKQMLRLFGERTLFQAAVERLEGLFPPERILVVTVEDQADELRRQAPEIPPFNFLLEPAPRGTASVVGLAAVALARSDPQSTMAVLTADHFIRDEAHFRQLLDSARLAATDGFLVTFGIKPAFPATGYGYIHYGQPVGVYNGQQAYRVQQFVEKPDLERAREMTAGGQHAWNSGMFIWRVQQILAEFERQMPDLAAGLHEISQALGTDGERNCISSVWADLRPETIDYGIMEGAEKVAMVQGAGLGWSDVGSWDSLYDILPADGEGNFTLQGELIPLDSRNVLLVQSGESRPVVALGLEDVVVVDAGDVLLICDRAQAQKVRSVVEHLEKSGRVDLT